MTYTIHPLTLEDIPEIFAMAQKSFFKANRHLYNPYPCPPSSYAQLLQGQLDLFSARHPNTALKAVDDATGHIVGAAGWGVHAEDEPVTQTLEETVEARMQPRVPELCEDVFRGVYTAMNEGRREVIGIEEEGKVVRFKKRVELQFLYTHPEYQRRGIGSALLKRFLEETGDMGLVFYLQATDDGRPLYEKIGFEVVLKRTYLFEDGDGDAEPYNISFMVKSPMMKTLCISSEGLHSPETTIA